MGDGHVAVDGYLVGLIGGWMLYNHYTERKGETCCFLFLQIPSLLRIANCEPVHTRLWPV